MTPHFLLNELQEAAAKAEGCLFCWLESYQVDRYLTGVANDGVNNIPLRQKLAARGGYCAAHCARFAKLASPLPTAILLESFLKQRLANAERGKRPTRINCEACEIAQKTQQTFAKNLYQHRKSPEIQELIFKSNFCLDHLELVCQQLTQAPRQKLIAEHDDLRRNLAELIRKHDYRFTDEIITDEEKRSLTKILNLFSRD